MALMRLDKFISGQLPNISRSNVKNLCKRGYVTVNGRTEKNSEIKIDPDTAKVTVSGREIVYREHLYIMLNKPQGVVCSTKDGLSETVLELLPPSLRRQGLFPAGRLDKDTTGLMIITDDGDFAHRILAPKKHVPKKYAVTIDLPVTDEMEKGFSEGIELSDGICKSAKLLKTGNYTCEVTLSEGRYHQIKRMFGCFGAKVTELHRLSMGGFCLPENLLPGECRELTNEELALIESKVNE